MKWNNITNIRVVRDGGHKFYWRSPSISNQMEKDQTTVETSQS